MSAHEDMLAALDRMEARSARLEQIGTLARGLMAEHRLDGWELRWDDARERAGLCGHGWISLSAPLMALWPEGEIRDTILHEIAHALTPDSEPWHGLAWQLTCLRIGAVPEARYDGKSLPAPPKRWVGRCAAGHPVSYRNQRPGKRTRRVSCGICRPGVFDERYLVDTWERNG